jgi:hypothetical protein
MTRACEDALILMSRGWQFEFDDAKKRTRRSQRLVHPAGGGARVIAWADVKRLFQRGLIAFNGRDDLGRVTATLTEKGERYFADKEATAAPHP